MGLALFPCPAAPAGDQDSESVRTVQIHDVSSPLGAHARVVKLLPDGARVAKGDLVCELDATEPKRRHAVQQRAVNRAKPDLISAQTSLEVAELALKEYLEGTYLSDEAEVEAIQALAREERAVCKEELDHLMSLGVVSELARRRARLTLARADRALKVAAVKAEMLPTEKLVKQTEGMARIAGAESETLKAKQKLEWAEEELGRLAGVVEQHRLVAPCDGIVIWPTPHAAGKREGKFIGPGQLVFRVVEMTAESQPSEPK